MQQPILVSGGAGAARGRPGVCEARRECDSVVARAPLSIRLLSVNTHKGFSSLNRRFILHELREAVRSVSADVVFLQDVLGYPLLRLDRIDVRNADVNEPIVLPRRPWSDVSDHAPLAAEITV